MSSFFPLFTEYSSQLWQHISFEHHLAMHFERNYTELWRNHVETKQPGWSCSRWVPIYSWKNDIDSNLKDNLEIVVVFPLVYWIFFSIMTAHLFWASPCNAFWTELYGVMAKPCRNQATRMELFTMSSYLFVKEWYWLKLVTNEMVRLRNKTSFLFYYFFFVFV